MNQGTAIVLWCDNVGYVLEKHQNIVVESSTQIRLSGQLYPKCSAIEYLNNPNVKWQSQHFLEVLIPWPTKIGYYKEKVVVSVPVDAIASLQEWMEYDISYIEILSILKSLKNDMLSNVSQSSFELKFHDTSMYTPLNTFTKILGPSEITDLKKLQLFGLTFFQWDSQWIPLIEALATETKYIGIAHHTNGVWALPLIHTPKLIHVPAQLNDVLSHIVDLLQT